MIDEYNGLEKRFHVDGQTNLYTILFNNWSIDSRT